jgi:predicted transcriptional regulator
VVEGLAVEVAVDSLVVVGAEAEVEVVEGFLEEEAAVIGLTEEIRHVDLH